MDALTFEIPGQPVPQPRVRVSTWGGRGRAYVPKGHAIHAYRQAVQIRAALALKQAKAGSLAGPVALRAEFVFARPASHWTKGGLAKAAGWLYARDVSRFNPGAAPPLTEAKIIMIEQGRSTAESYLVEMMRKRTGEFARGVVGSPFHGLCDRVAAGAPSGVKVPQAALLHALKEAGWIDCGRLKSRAYDTRKHVFCAPDMVQHSKSDLRNMVEEPASPLLARVK